MWLAKVKCYRLSDWELTLKIISKHPNTFQIYSYFLYHTNVNTHYSLNIAKT